MNRRELIKALIGLPALLLVPKKPIEPPKLWEYPKWQGGTIETKPQPAGQLVSFSESGFTLHFSDLPQKTGSVEVTGLGFEPSMVVFGFADKIDGQSDIVAFTSEGVQVKTQKGHIVTLPTSDGIHSVFSIRDDDEGATVTAH